MHDWSAILRQNRSVIWTAAYRVLRHTEDAADCCQDVVIEAMKRADRQPVTNWPAFLQWLTVRRAIDRLRERQRQQKLESEVSRHVQEADEGHSGSGWDELIEVIRQELVHLPPQQAQVFWLHCVQDVALSEVAAQLQLTEPHVRVLLHRARKRLQQKLKHRFPALAEEKQ